MAHTTGQTPLRRPTDPPYWPLVRSQPTGRLEGYALRDDRQQLGDLVLVVDCHGVALEVDLPILNCARRARNEHGRSPELAK